MCATVCVSLESDLPSMLSFLPFAVMRTLRAPRATGSVVSSARPAKSTRFGGSSATPCETIVRAKSTGSPPAPLRRSSAAATNAFEQVGQREVREGRHEQIRLVERERLGDRIRNGDDEDSGGFRCANAVDGVLEGDRLPRLEAEQFQGLDVEIGIGLRARSIAVRGDDRPEPVRASETLQMAANPVGVAAGDDRRGEPSRVGFSQVILDPRPQLLEVAELELARAPPLGQRGAVERPADELLEMLVGIEVRPDRPDERRPALERELVPVLAVQLLVRAARRRLGVDQETVEVEQEPADRHGVSLPEWRSSASTSVARSPMPCCSTTGTCRPARC